MQNTEFPEALKRFGGDAALLSGTAAMVSEDAPLELQQLDAALDKQDREQARMSAHTLKGMLATFAEEGDAVKGLHQIEQLTMQDDLIAANSELTKIRQDVEQLIVKITAFVESNTVV